MQSISAIKFRIKCPSKNDQNMACWPGWSISSRAKYQKHFDPLCDLYDWFQW